MEYQFPDNTASCNVTYMRTRTGPNFFRVYYKQGCCIRFTPKEVGRVFGIAKFTPTVNKIRDWCKEMVDKYESSESCSSQNTAKTNTEWSEAERSLGSHDDIDTTDTTTKMIL